LLHRRASSQQQLANKPNRPQGVMQERKRRRQREEQEIGDLRHHRQAQAVFSPMPRTFPRPQMEKGALQRAWAVNSALNQHAGGDLIGQKLPLRFGGHRPKRRTRRASTRPSTSIHRAGRAGRATPLRPVQRAPVSWLWTETRQVAGEAQHPAGCSRPTPRSRARKQGEKPFHSSRFAFFGRPTSRSVLARPRRPAVFRVQSSSPYVCPGLCGVFWAWATA